MHGKHLTEGDIPRQMWSLAWPLMLSVFFYTLYNTVDAFWVGRLSPEAIAAVSISQLTLFAMVALSMGINAGSGVLMAMRIGANKIDDAERILGQSFVLSAVFGLLFTVVGLVFRDFLLKAAGATGTIFPLAMEYYVVSAAGLVLLFVMMSIIFSFNAEGDTFTLTKLFAISTLANAILDPLFIFGWNGFPAFGIAGAAIATLISQLIFIVMSLYIITRPSMMVRLRISRLVLDFSLIKQVFSIGFPAALTNVVGPVGSAALTFIAASYFGEAGAVAASIGFRVEFFAFLPAIGYGFGAMAMLGQNIGAKNYARAKAAYSHGLKIGFLLALAFGILSAIFAKQLISIFTSDPVVIEYTTLYLRSITFSYGFFAALLIQASAFQGIGKSWPGFFIYVIKFAVVAVPLSILLIQVFSFSITGIWIGILVSNLVASAVGYFWLDRTLSKLLSEKIN